MFTRRGFLKRALAGAMLAIAPWTRASGAPELPKRSWWDLTTELELIHKAADEVDRDLVRRYGQRHGPLSLLQAELTSRYPDVPAKDAWAALRERFGDKPYAELVRLKNQHHV